MVDAHQPPEADDAHMQVLLISGLHVSRHTRAMHPRLLVVLPRETQSCAWTLISICLFTCRPPLSRFSTDLSHGPLQCSQESAGSQVHASDLAGRETPYCAWAVGDTPRSGRSGWRTHTH